MPAGSSHRRWTWKSVSSSQHSFIPRELQIAKIMSAIMLYQYCSKDKAISFLDLQQVPWCFTIYSEELHPQNTKIQAPPSEQRTAARPSSDTSNFSLFIWMRLFLLTHWSQDIYFKFKIHFLTLWDLLCSTTENASILWLLEKITRSIIILLQKI